MKRNKDELLLDLCKEIRTLITKFSTENYKQFSDISKVANVDDRISIAESLGYQGIVELSECVELSTRALAFELGYNKQMLSQFPENIIDKMIVDELYYGKLCFDNEYKIAIKIKESTKKQTKKDFN